MNARLGAWALYAVTWRSLTGMSKDRGLFFSALVQRTSRSSPR
ncbi:MAG: hypothetical protein ACHQ7M_13675 [Chloroflexota bacterium]